MAITEMTTREEFEAHQGDTNYWIDVAYMGHRPGVIRHALHCPHYNETSEVVTQNGKTLPDCDEHCWISEPLYMRRHSIGLVLSLGEHNGYDDSDFYAMVWSPEKGAPYEDTYASTRGWTYPNHAEVDATPEVLEAYKAYQERRAAESRAFKAAQEAKTPRVGKTVKVVRGRKVPQGTMGTVVWVGKDKFRGEPRVGLRDAKGQTHFTAGSNVEVVLQEAAA